jgi:uncharacterized protein (TIGR02231 family)
MSTLLDSRIVSVTVYTDRAQVTRSAKHRLVKGEHALLFDGLPEAIDRNSVQVSGSGNMTLKNIAFAQEHFAEAADQGRKALLERKQRLEDTLAEADSRVARASGEKGFLESIAKRLTGMTQNSAPADLDPDRWMKMVEFYRSKQDSIDKEMRDTQLGKRKAQDELEKVDAEIESLGDAEDKTRNQVEVVVEAGQEGEVTLNLSYIVHGPSWRPLYDLRVLSDRKKLSITYNAMVTQASGEDWTDIGLMLSTARPQVGGEEPQMNPWRIDIARPLPPPAPPRAAGAPMMSRKMRAADDAAMVAEDRREEYELAVEPPAMLVPETTVEAGATSAVFSVAGRTNIPDDNSPHRVTVMLQELDAQFHYATTPRLAPFAYLKAKVTNTTDYPFLPGETNIFLDSSFVASASLKLVAPTEEFWTFLGVDEGIKVEHKFLKKYQKEEGILSKRTKFIYDYQIKVTNNKKTEEQITVRDQLPISGHQDIGVELMENKANKGTVSPRKNELSLLEWTLSLKPGEKAGIPFSFSVEWPRGERVVGLE